MHTQTSAATGSARHRAEDDLFHYDRSQAPKMPESAPGLFQTKASARYWVVSMRPRWLVGRSQPLLRPRCEG